MEQLKKSDVKFYFDKQMFIGVTIPFGCRPTSYMACGKDNRPFDAIFEDIKVAYEMLYEEKESHGYTKDVAIAYDLHKLLGYKRATAGLKVC